MDQDWVLVLVLKAKAAAKAHQESQEVVHTLKSEPSRAHCEVHNVAEAKWAARSSVMSYSGNIGVNCFPAVSKT